MRINPDGLTSSFLSFAVHGRPVSWDSSSVSLHQSPPLSYRDCSISNYDEGRKASCRLGGFAHRSRHSYFGDGPSYVSQQCLPFTNTHAHDSTEVIVQGHRFNIFEELGCFPMTYNTPPAYPLVFCWPVVIGVISACYCCKYRVASISFISYSLNSSHDHSRFVEETRRV